MSAQAGILYYDGRPVNPELVTSMGRLLDAFGPDRAAQYVAPGIAMVHRALHVTPEDRQERQPLISTRGAVMTWDGRLDNRKDLLLQLWHDLDDDTTDVALAMAAFEKWGPSGFSKLVGDWSAVVLDPEARTVVLASDYMSVRPLHYCVRGDSVSWSTTLQCVVEINALHDALDERFVVSYVSLTQAPGLTPYKGVLAVPGAHAVILGGRGKTAPRRFWSMQSTELRCHTQEAYEEHLRDVFSEAVGSRLRSSTPVWAHLSGGLDSSTLVCTADVLVREGLVAAPDLQTVCYVSPDSPESDETRFMSCVDEQRARASHYIPFQRSHELVDHERFWVTPVQSTGQMLATFQLVRQSGGRLLLTGVGGDGVMGNYLDYHYDTAGLLRSGRPIAAVRLARRRALAAKRTVAGLMYDAFLEVFPSRLWVSHELSNLIHQVGGRRPATDEHIADLFALTPPSAASWREEWSRHLSELLSFPDVSQRRTASGLMRLADRRQAQSPSEEPLAMASHPYLHRPLVDLMLGIPFGVVAPPGEPRGLMRRTFSPVVPQRIISRFSKGYGSPFNIRDVRKTVGEWLGQPAALRILRFDCFDRNRLIQYLEGVRDGTRTAALFANLLRLEHWLTARDRRRSIEAVHSTPERR